MKNKTHTPVSIGILQKSGIDLASGIIGEYEDNKDGIKNELHELKDGIKNEFNETNFIG